MFVDVKNFFKRLIGDLTMIKSVSYDAKAQKYVIEFCCGATYKTSNYIEAKSIIDRKFAA